MATDFTLPELGENVTTGDVLSVLVKAGDTVTKDQPVLELETDKATIEVPSSVAGHISAVKVKQGDSVKVGQVIFSVDDGAVREGTTREAAPRPVGQPAAAGAVPAETERKAPDAGALEQHVEGQRRPPPPDVNADGDVEQEDTPPPPRQRTGGAAGDAKVVDISRGARTAAEPAPQTPELPPAPAAPSVRRMARELGVNIHDVKGTGANGRISTEDVKAYAKQLVTGIRRGGAAAEALPDFSGWGDIERQPMRAVRRKTAEHVTSAWSTIPHVTQHDLADITTLEDLRKRYAKQTAAAGGNLTITAIALKVAAAALKIFPQFNTSVDLAAQEIIYKKYVNIGIAVDTDRGLLVPVIRDADRKSIVQLAVELSQVSEKARAHKLTAEEMQGGTFTITNLGGIGGTAFTPIINSPEVAILGLSRARIEPVYVDAGANGGAPQSGRFEPRLMLPLSLSYDHRVIDGADGIRFLRWVAEALEQPFLLSLQA